MPMDADKSSSSEPEPAPPARRARQRVRLKHRFPRILFVADVAPIAPDLDASRRLYLDTLQLPFASTGEGELYAESLPGVTRMGVWRLAKAARMCFGVSNWPTHLPTPQLSIEFEVETEAAVDEGASQLEGAGFTILRPPSREAWGQTLAYTQSPEGLLIGLSWTGSMRTRLE